MKRSTFGLLAAGCALSVGVGLTVAIEPASAKDGSPANGTAATALDQAAALQPLRDIANALGDQGRGTFADTYANLYIDADRGRVTLYVTDPSRATKLIAAAKAAAPAIATSRIDVVRAGFSKVALDRQIATMMNRSDALNRYAMVSAAAAPDGSGIQVVTAAKAMGVNTPAAAQSRDLMAADLAGTSGIPVSISTGDSVQPTAWRWNDTFPLIGGDVALGPAREAGYRAQCTTGLGLEDSAGRDYVTVAAHCFPSGSAVYGEGDSTGNFGYNYGNRYGTVTSVNAGWDTELVATGRSHGAGSNSDEADQPTGKWYVVNSAKYSYNGDYVCQDGTRSYYTGHGVPCGIKVINQDITYSIKWDDGTTHSVRGVEGHASSGWAVTQGDSGGLVFSISSSSTRQARGSVSASSGNAYLYWTEAPDIMKAFGLHLNPHV